MLTNQDECDLDRYRAILERAKTPRNNISRIIYEFAKLYCNPAEKIDIDHYLVKHNYRAYTQEDLDKWQDDP